MHTNNKIKLVLAAIFVNIVLSLVIPAILSKEDDKQKTFMSQIKRIFQTNNDVIIANSIIIGLTVYLAIEIIPFLSECKVQQPDQSDLSFIASVPFDPRLLGISSIR
jgi:hypothetical protein